MGTITSLGKYIFLIPFAAFGVFHVMQGADMAVMVIPKLPAGTALVYLTGIAQLAFVLSALMGKLDKLAAVLLAVMLMVIIVFIHVPGLSAPDNTTSMTMMLKDIGLTGGALMYAGAYATDKSVIG